jgi:hypothetical protein
VKDVRDALKLRAAAWRGARARLGVVVQDLFTPVLRVLEDPAAAKIARRRLRLIAKAPALLNHETLLEIEEVIATTVAATHLPAGTPPSLVARTLVSTSFGALLWWAEHGKTMSPLQALRAALKTIALASDE